MNEATTQSLLSAVRSILIVVGSILTTKGVVDDATVQAAVGAIMTILPIAWGMWDKRRVEQKTQAREVVAVNAGIAIANQSPGIVQPVAAADVPYIIAAAGPAADTKKGNP